MEYWYIINKVQAVYNNTTASNTGRICVNESCILLEQFIKRNILYLLCRHHISDLILGNVFDYKLNFSTLMYLFLYSFNKNDQL